jgi:hypothetical protein
MFTVDPPDNKADSLQQPGIDPKLIKNDRGYSDSRLARWHIA